MACMEFRAWDFLDGGGSVSFAGKIKEAISSKLAELVVGTAMAAVSAVSLFTVKQFWGIYDYDPTAVTMLSASIFALGLVTGFLARLACERLFPNGRKRSLIRRLPRNQKAILGIALDASGVVTMWSHEKDIEYLDSVGLIKSFQKAWAKEFTATDDARRAVSGHLRDELVAAGKEMLEEERREEVERKADELAKTDPSMRDVLFKIISEKAGGLIVPETDHWSSYETKAMNETLEDLQKLGMCDYEMRSAGRKWIPTKLLLEIWESHPDLFTEY